MDDIDGVQIIDCSEDGTDNCGHFFIGKAAATVPTIFDQFFYNESKNTEGSISNNFHSQKNEGFSLYKLINLDDICIHYHNRKYVFPAGLICHPFVTLLSSVYVYQ